MNQEITISPDVLENLFQEFTQFIKNIADEDFISFRKSSYLNEQEGYKKSLFEQAKSNLNIKNWKSEDIGTGRIQKVVDAAILKKVNHRGQMINNNLVHWMLKDNFTKLGKDRNLEQLFFDFYKNKITPQIAFEGFTEYFDYQLIAYLFFINNDEAHLPISQKAFDRIIEEKLQISNFKTSGQCSWDNYKTYKEIIKQVHRFLRGKVSDSKLLDAHSFLWILGNQREEWLNEQNLIEENSEIENDLQSEERHERLDYQALVNRGVEIRYSQKEIVSEVKSNINGNPRTFTPTDIVWIKNITDHVRKQAYLDLTGEELNKFVLLFPDQHKGNIRSPQVGEIILLRQYVNGVSAFTHLVSPIDDEFVEDNIYPGFSYGRNACVIAMTPIDNLILADSVNWKDVSSRGNAVKIENIYKNGMLDNLQLSIWERFKPFFVDSQQKSLEVTSEILKEIETSDLNLTVTEGKMRLVGHYARERNSEIVRVKKEQAKMRNELYCEVCTFSFKKTYDVDFIECHHRTPISETGITETTLNDLALVCANCHRMLHKQIEGKFLSISELKNRLS